MRIRFRATDGGFDADDYALLCGVDGPDADGVDHALSFDRLSESAAATDPDDDWGVHTEFDDQSNGEYGRVGQCRLSRTALSVDLSGQLGGLAAVEGFDVELIFSDEVYEQVRAGLTRIFRGMPGVLVSRVANSLIISCATPDPQVRFGQEVPHARWPTVDLTHPDRR
ncbi:MAG: hypothetical protein JWO38_6042, partial [Gemmataceae bacterium]|nr:hypothetical protein [Gemmataceae bacterium]